MRTVVIMGAGGRDFHNFNTVFRDDGSTRVVVHELYPSTEALDAAIDSGSAGIYGMPESLEQLDRLLVELAG